MKRTVEELLEEKYVLVDILPRRVPAGSPGQYFAVEGYLLREPQLSAVKQKHIDLILKLNCYRDISIAGEETVNPPPERLAEEMRRRYLYLLVGESMILSEPDDTHMTVFNPDEKLLELIRSLAAGEGLFVWQPSAPQQGPAEVSG